MVNNTAISSKLFSLNYTLNIISDMKPKMLIINIYNNYEEIFNISACTSNSTWEILAPVICIIPFFSFSFCCWIIAHCELWSSDFETETLHDRYDVSVHSLRSII